MLSFESDYIIGAHEKVLEALCKTNNEVLSGYGNDAHTKNAKELIKKACSKEKTTITLTTCFTNDFALENRGKSDFKMLGTIFTMA